MCEMDTPDIATIAAMADGMSAKSIVDYFKEKGITMEIVAGGVYPVGIKVGETTMYIPKLQPEEKQEDVA